MKRFISLAIMGSLLSACDPLEVIHLTHSGGEPVRCPGGKTTRYEVVHAVTDPDNRNEILYEERNLFTVDPKGGALSTDPDRVSAAIIAGSLDSGRIPWIQFIVTCGDPATHLLTTPKITREDLEKLDDVYLYVVE